MTQVVIQYGVGANFYIRAALVRAMQLNPDFKIFYWDDSGKSANDLFVEMPDMNIFISSTWQLSRSIIKNLAAQPHIKVALFADSYGELENEIDKDTYPVSFITESQLKLLAELQKSHPKLFLISQHNESALSYTHGFYKSKLGLDVLSLMCCVDISQYFWTKPSAEYHTNVVFCGGYWPYKSKYLDQYILPLCYPHTKLKVKIFGSGWSVPNSVSRADENTIRNYYASADIVPSICERHAIEVYADLPARFFQVAACGGFQISQEAIGLNEVFNKDEILTVPSADIFLSLVKDYIETEQDWGINYRELGTKRVYREHTNFHRVAKLLTALTEDNNWFISQAENLFEKTFPGEKYYLA